jgi:hypothetical protein
MQQDTQIQYLKIYVGKMSRGCMYSVDYTRLIHSLTDSEFTVS